MWICAHGTVTCIQHFFSSHLVALRLWAFNSLSPTIFFTDSIHTQNIVFPESWKLKICCIFAFGSINAMGQVSALKSSNHYSASKLYGRHYGAVKILPVSSKPRFIYQTASAKCESFCFRILSLTKVNFTPLLFNLLYTLFMVSLCGAGWSMSRQFIDWHLQRHCWAGSKCKRRKHPVYMLQVSNWQFYASIRMDKINTSNRVLWINW